MEIRHLRYMLAVADERQFHRAAKRIHIAQPALSQNIKQLEDEIGAPLFARTTRKVELTSAGRVFYEEAAQLLRKFDSLQRSALRASVGESGSITIGFTETAIFGPFRHVVQKFRVRYPDVRVVTRECTVAELYDKLLDGTLDIACSEECVPNASFDILNLPAVNVVVALHHEHPLAQEKGSIPMSLLADESFIFPTQNTTWSVYEKFARALAEAGVHPRQEYWADSAVSGVALVAAGLGVCLVPQFTQILHSEVVFRRVITPSIRLNPQVLWQKSNKDAATKNFVALAKSKNRSGPV